MKNLFVLLALSLFVMAACCPKEEAASANEQSFSFAFITDIHLQPEKRAPEGFRQAIDTINHLQPDFVITGGDNIMDALGTSYERADALYKLYQEESKRFAMPVYNTLGNHEIYGIHASSQADPNHPEYGEKMFEKRLGKSYYSFEHKGWKFFVLNSAEDTHKSGYIGIIDDEQMNWLSEELKSTDASMPLVISTHIPLLSAYAQLYYHPTRALDSSWVLVNAIEVINLFQDHNLKLVLQGHMHTVEELVVDGTHFITGGAISGRWWEGAYREFEEGFVMVHIDGDEFDWEYLDYGWTVEN